MSEAPTQTETRQRLKDVDLSTVIGSQQVRDAIELVGHAWLATEIPSQFREWYGKPFIRNGRLYATDGAIALRCKTLVGLADDKRDGSPPPIGDVLSRVEGEPLPPRWPLPDDCHFDLAPCFNCDGKGGRWRKEGEFVRRFRLCRECLGEGRLGHVMAGEARVNSRYARLIASLPQVKVFPPPANTKVRFLFEGGDGAVMPLRSPVGCYHRGVLPMKTTTELEQRKATLDAELQTVNDELAKRPVKGKA